MIILTIQVYYLQGRFVYESRKWLCSWRRWWLWNVSQNIYEKVLCYYSSCMELSHFRTMRFFEFTYRGVYVYDHFTYNIYTYHRSYTTLYYATPWSDMDSLGTICRSGIMSQNFPPWQFSSSVFCHIIAIETVTFDGFDGKLQHTITISICNTAKLHTYFVNQIAR
jgi:hypothetical protein